MGDFFYIMMIFGGFLFVLGVVYPVLAILVYPVYRLLGGRDSFKEYIKSL